MGGESSCYYSLPVTKSFESYEVRLLALFVFSEFPLPATLGLSRMPASSAPTRKFTVPLVVAVVAALIAGIMFLSSLGGDSSENTTSPKAGEGASPNSDDPFLALVRREEGDPLARGEVDAPVVMLAYSEFQCPFCGKFARDTEPELVKKYVENGTLRIEWHDFPYLGNESTLAAHAGRAAAAQDKFWEFQEAMYANQQPPNSGKLTEEYLISVAEDIGLDTAKFEEAMNSEAVQQAVQADFLEGQQIGVTGTPAFLINGQPIMGAQPLEVFEQAIESAAVAAK